jgi:hypothetical protein
MDLRTPRRLWRTAVRGVSRSRPRNLATPAHAPTWSTAMERATRGAVLHAFPPRGRDVRPRAITCCRPRSRDVTSPRLYPAHARRVALPSSAPGPSSIQLPFRSHGPRATRRHAAVPESGAGALLLHHA